MLSRSAERCCCRYLKTVFQSCSTFGKLSLSEFEQACSELELEISPEGCLSMYQEWFGSLDKKLLYSEFCLFIACYLRNLHAQKKIVTYEHEVFLGGACNPTTWRPDAAIPFLENAKITYFNPQVQSWSPELVEIEARAKASSYMLLYVFEAWKTRAVSSFVEFAYLAAQGHNVVLVLIQHSPTNPLTIAGEHVSPAEQACLLQAGEYIREIAIRLGIPVFDQLSDALNYVQQSVLEHRDLIQKRATRKFSSLRSSEQRLIESVIFVRKVFNSLKPTQTGVVTVQQARTGLQMLNANFPCHSAFREVTMKTINFEQFCVAFAAYVFQHCPHELFSPSIVSLDDENVSSVSPLGGDTVSGGSGVGGGGVRSNCGRLLRHTRSLYISHGSGLSERLQPILSTESFNDTKVKGSEQVECSSRQRRIPFSISFDEPNNLRRFNLTSRHLKAFKSWINGFRKLPVLGPSGFPDEPSCQASYDVYVSGSLNESVSSTEHSSLSALHKSVCRPLSVFFADDEVNLAQSPASAALWELDDELTPEQRKSWARTHSHALLYVVKGDSFNLCTMIEAAFSIGLGLPVILYVDHLQVNETTCQPERDIRHPQVLRSTCIAQDRSNLTDCTAGKRARSDHQVESFDSTEMRLNDASNSSNSPFCCTWVKQTSCPNDDMTSFSLTDERRNRRSNTTGSMATSPVCHSAASVLNPSVDSGLGLTSDSAELLDGHSELDSHCASSDRLFEGHSVNHSLNQDKTVLPKLWEDSVLSLVVSNGVAKDHNRGRVYLTSIAKEMGIPVTSRIEEALDWCRIRLNSCYKSPNTSQPSTPSL